MTKWFRSLEEWHRDLSVPLKATTPTMVCANCGVYEREEHTDPHFQTYCVCAKCGEGALIFVAPSRH